MSPTQSEPRLSVTRIAGRIGAQISGIDLVSDLTDNVVAQLKEELLRHRVLFFRDQRLDHETQIALAGKFGKVTPAHPYELDAPRQYPEILELDSRIHEKRTGEKRFTYDYAWHSDVTALINPPRVSILRGEIVPPFGGDTQWTNTVAAYEALPPELRVLAESIRARHRFPATQYRPGSPQHEYALEHPLTTNHPGVIVIPETDERALYVSPGFTRHDKQVLGFDQRHSESILNLLWDQLAKPEFTVRFTWQPGSVAIWDNWTTNHLGPRDLVNETEFDRVHYRVTTEGTVPRGIDGRESESVQGEPFLGRTVS